jgi:FkbM family methyltransferase
MTSASDKRLGRRAVVWGLHQIPLSRGKGRLTEWLATRLTPSESKEVVVGAMTAGFRMHLHLGDPQERLMYFSGEYEHLTANVFKMALRPGDIVIDGGANIGYYSLLSATMVGQEGSVHAFEPIPDTFDALTANVAVNNFVRIHLNQTALSDHAGELQFEVPLDKQTHQPLRTGARQVLLGDGPVTRVLATTLDDYAASRDIAHIRLVKLDLEGGELEAVKGMQNLLSTHAIDYLIAESNTWLLEKRQMSGREVTEAVARYGYRPYAIGSTFWGGTHIEKPTLQKYAVEEFLYVAPGLEVPSR